MLVGQQEICEDDLKYTPGRTAHATREHAHLLQHHRHPALNSHQLSLRYIESRKRIRLRATLAESTRRFPAATLGVKQVSRLVLNSQVYI